MKLQIHGDKIVVTSAIKNYCEEKFKRVSKYFLEENNLKANINVRVKNKIHTIEVTIPTKNFILRAEEKSDDLYKSIDLVIDKLERQITKNKEKIQKKYKNTKDFNFEVEVKEEELILDIVKRKNLSIKPMDEEEAILQMQMIGHDFFVFKNLDEECVSVIYKRKDEKFGIINVK